MQQQAAAGSRSEQGSKNNLSEGEAYQFVLAILEDGLDLVPRKLVESEKVNLTPSAGGVVAILASSSSSSRRAGIVY